MDWNSIKDFRGIIPKAKRDRLISVKQIDSIETAVYLAYNDTKRTLSGVSKLAREKENAIGQIKKGILDYFDSLAPSTAEEYDAKHEDLCEIWCRAFAESDIASYGKAQKIVNMSFKYLLCCEDAKDYLDYFKFCHIPLDKYVLEWCDRKMPGLQWKEVAWSKLKKETYKMFQGKIRIKAAQEGLSPLLMDFVIWPRIQKELVVEQMIYCFDIDSDKRTTEYFDTLRQASLEEKLKRVKELLELNEHII